MAALFYLAIHIIMTFEAYLRQNTAPNKKGPDHSLRASCGPVEGVMEFYIHPSGEDGDTVDFYVIGNQLLPKFAPHGAQISFCTRHAGHENPCNGYPRKDCF